MTTNLLLIALFVFCMILMSLNLSKRKKKIIFFGDNVNALDMRPGGYISWFIDGMKEEGEEEHYTILQSIKFGEKIYDLYQRLDDNVLLKDVHTVIIYVGVQDVLDKYEKGTGTDLPTFAHLYATIIQKMINRNIRIITGLPSPLLKANFTDDMLYDMKAYSDIIQSIADEYHVTLVDFERLRLENLDSQVIVSNLPQPTINQTIGITLWKIFKGLK